MKLENHQHLFWAGCLIEGSLVGVAAILGWMTGQPVFGDLHWNAADALAGLLACVPLLAGFFWMIQTDFAPLVEIRNFLETVARPIFQQWSLGQLLALSAMAGIGEEVLFRAVIQGSLSGPLGTIPALIVSGAIFGAFHMITRAYAILAGVIGIFLGWLWLATDNLLAPIVTHAVYDFIALTYFVRMDVSNTDVDEE